MSGFWVNVYIKHALNLGKITVTPFFKQSVDTEEYRVEGYLNSICVTTKYHFVCSVFRIILSSTGYFYLRISKIEHTHLQVGTVEHYRWFKRCYVWSQPTISRAYLREEANCKSNNQRITWGNYTSHSQPHITQPIFTTTQSGNSDAQRFHQGLAERRQAT